MVWNAKRPWGSCEGRVLKHLEQDGEDFFEAFATIFVVNYLALVPETGIEPVRPFFTKRRILSLGQAQTFTKNRKLSKIHTVTAWCSKVFGLPQLCLLVLTCL
jgi:hypothetical protein